MTFNEEIKHHKDHQERKKDSRRGYMYARPGNPRCPVASVTPTPQRTYILPAPKEERCRFSGHLVGLGLSRLIFTRFSHPTLTRINNNDTCFSLS